MTGLGCLGFGAGTVGVSVMLNVVTTYLPALMATVLGKSVALAGLLVTVSKLYDIGADLGIGAISDRTRSPWGARRPYLLAGALVSALSFALIFGAPASNGMAFALYMGAMLVVYSTGYSLFNIPYLALAGEITRTYGERTRLMAFRTFFIAVGQMVSLAGAGALIERFGRTRQGYLEMGLAMAALIALSMLTSFLSTAKAARLAATRPAARKIEVGYLASLGENRPLLTLMGVKFLQYICIAMAGSTQLLFMLNALKAGYAGQIGLAVAQNLALAASMPAWVRLARRRGKRTSYQAAVVILAIGYLSWLLAGAHPPMWSIWLRGLGLGIGSGGVLLMGVAMLPDTMEYDRLRTGLDRQGLFSSFYAIVEKVSWALGPAIIGAALSAAGYRPTTAGKLVTQPESAIRMLYVSNAVIPAACLLASVALLAAYRLDEATLERARAGALQAARDP